MIIIKYLRGIVLLPFILLIFGCSLSDTKSGKLIYESIDLHNFSYADKQKYGVELLYSPNKKRVIYADHVYDFNSLYVVEKESHTKIFDFKEVLGEHEVRDKVPLSYYWKDDQSVYVILPYAYINPRVYEIDVSTKSITVLDLPVNGFVIGYSPQSTSFLLLDLADNESKRSFLLYNQGNGEQTNLPKLDNYQVQDIEDGKYILSDSMTNNIILFDLNTKTYNKIELNFNNPKKFSIIPNTNEVSVFDNNDLVIYDYKENKVLSRLSLNEQNINLDMYYTLNWNMEGSCFYSTVYLVCKQ